MLCTKLEKIKSSSSGNVDGVMEILCDDIVQEQNSRLWTDSNVINLENYNWYPFYF